MFKKTILFFLWIWFILLYSGTFAWDYDIQINECLSKLKNQVSSEYGVDISSVSVNGVDSDLSVYTWSAGSTWQKIFNEVLKENPSTGWCEYALWYSWDECKSYFSHVFFAKRNNISTIKITPEKRKKGYWTMTEFVTWWWDTAFNFPLQKWDDPQFNSYDYYSEWDSYWLFKQNLIYVQYLLDGTFLSCWYIKLSGDNLDNINQNNYMGNKFEWWWFQKLGKWDIWSDKFYWMKVLVKWLDWGENDLFDLNLIAIAYDNLSSYFNEYISYPLQIKAMTDTVAMASEEHTMQNVIMIYQRYLHDNTCFKLVHKNKPDLPKFCWLDYNSSSDLISYVKHNSMLSFIYNFFLDNVYALDMPSDAKERAKKVLDSNSIATRNWIKLTTRLKLEKIKNESLKSKLIYVLSPASKVFIAKKQDKWEYISYDERIYKNCSLKHDQIAKNIEYIFDHYYKNWKLDLSTPKYLNPEFGDCIIPYPDVRHKNKLIENSFIENKIAFIKETFWKDKVNTYEQEIHKATSSYEKKIQSLKKQYKEKLFAGDKKWADVITKKIENEYNLMQKSIDNIAKNDKDLSKYIELKKKALDNVSSKDISILSNNKNMTYLIFIVIWLIILSLWMFLVYNKNKKW